MASQAGLWHGAKLGPGGYLRLALMGPVTQWWFKISCCLLGLKVYALRLQCKVECACICMQCITNVHEMQITMNLVQKLLILRDGLLVILQANHFS